MRRFFVGTYTELGGPGIALCQRDGDALRILATDNHMANPIWLLPTGNRQTLYASGADVTTGQGVVAGYRIDGDHMELMSMQPTAGSDVCHLVLSADERFLYASNYATGSLAVFPVNGTEIGPRIQLVSHHGCGSDPVRQEGPHIHQAVFRPGTQELFVCDLGLDTIFIYGASAEDGLLTLRARISGELPGYGPRHLLFRDACSFYLVSEMGSAVSLFRLEDEIWQCEQTLSTLPSTFTGENTAAALRMRDGHLYVSNRGHDSLAEFALSDTGRMTFLAHHATGACPRDFDFDTDGALLTANQLGGGVTLSRADTILSQADIPGAVCICLM